MRNVLCITLTNSTYIQGRAIDLLHGDKMNEYQLFKALIDNQRVTFTHPFTNRRRFGYVESVGVIHSIVAIKSRNGWPIRYKVENSDILDGLQ